MKLSQIAEILEAEYLCGKERCDMEIESICGSDLMSDVMAYVKEGGMLLTGLIHPQVIRTAEMMDISAIVFVRGKKPDENIIKLAIEKNIAILSTALPMYQACGRIYSASTGEGKT